MMVKSSTLPFAGEVVHLKQVECPQSEQNLLVVTGAPHEWQTRTRSVLLFVPSPAKATSSSSESQPSGSETSGQVEGLGAAAGPCRAADGLSKRSDGGG
ncbi:hypothetical protein BN1723_006840 [Verticillium longisporum]|uniref:Uncharacterized protein n=1 Tax=Verticillium longisporum TaxID=100787 RepID=A0A0G4NI56_VERLO|nr:hypothetical protein BN1723_006840 [Verticillium longisporum]